MPAQKEYLEGYGLHEGMILAGHQLMNINLKHETIATYREYRYPIVMMWKNIDSKYSTQNLINTLDQHVRNDRVIYTKYGNPYECHFGNLDHHYVENNTLVINAIGYCKRVYK